MGGKQHQAKVILALLLLAGAAPCHPLLAQSGAELAQSGADPLNALRHGTLVVWYVGNSVHSQEMAIQAVSALNDFTPLNYTEHSAANFGQNASSFGQNAASFGVDADSKSISVPSIPANRDATTATPNGIGYKQQDSSTFGQNEAGFGSTAGGYGMESGSYGQNSAGFGQTSASYGTEASNVGQNASSFAEPENQTTALSSVSQSLQMSSSPEEERIQQRLRQAYPDLQVSFYAVSPSDLQSMLTGSRGSKEYPDVLVGTLPAAWWAGMDSNFGLVSLQPAVFYPNGVLNHPESAAEVAILADAANMQAARAFALWMSEPFSDCPGCVAKSLSGPAAGAAAVARKAIQRLVNGVPLGSLADPRMARNSSQGQRRLLATIGDAASVNGGMQVQVEQASVHGSLAAIALRVLISTPGIFGVVHPLVVLRQSRRTAKPGPWKVLQLTLDLPQYEQTQERQVLMVSDPPTWAEQRGGVKGVSLLQPTDGQDVVQMPQLLWQNHGGAGLEVVEWQKGEGQGWSESRLYFVEDQNPTLRMQAMAKFAARNGRYRWRLWSVGAHGEMRISSWSSFFLER